MTLHETPRDKPRIILMGRSEYIDLDEYLDEDPQVEKAAFSVVQSISGRVQTLYERKADTLKLKQIAPDLERAKELQRLWRMMLSRGERIEIIRDRARYFHLYGDIFENDVIEDECNRQKPQSGSYSRIFGGGRYSLGSVAVDPANPVGTTRTNLIPNGDLIDGTAGSVPTGWTNSTSSTLSAVKSTYNRLNTIDGSQIKFVYLQTGTKSAYVTFDTDSIAPNATPSKGLTFSFRIRSDRNPASTISNLVLVELVVSGGSTYTVYQDTPTTEWERVSTFVDLSAETATATTGHQLKFTFTNDLKSGPVYVTEIQAEHRRGVTAFIPYSTARTTLAGSRSVGSMKWLNGLHYKHQEPMWKNGNRWGFTVAFDFSPGFGANSLPGWTIISGYNDKLDFVRGVTTYAATLTAGQYDCPSIATEIQRAMRAADSGNAYTCTYDTSTKKFTIAGTGTFSMPWLTGVNTATSVGPTIGFTADDSGTNSYLADSSDTGFVWLYHDGETTASLYSTPALTITTSLTTVTATVLLDSGSTSTLQKTSVTWTAHTAKHIMVSFRDWNGADAGSGSFALYVDGAATSTTHSSYGARQGESFWIGGNLTETSAAGGEFSNFRIDPVYIDGTTYTSGDYYDTDTPPDRLRNAWYAKALKADPLVEFSNRDNCYLVQCELIEDRV